MVDTSPADRPAIVSIEAGLRPWRLEVVMGCGRKRSEDAVTTVSGRSEVENHIRVGARLVKTDCNFHRRPGRCFPLIKCDGNDVKLAATVREVCSVCSGTSGDKSKSTRVQLDRFSAAPLDWLMSAKLRHRSVFRR